MNGNKYDEGKPRIDLVPPAAITAAARVFTYGARKYGDHNWKDGIAFSRLYSALWRHMLAWWDGENLDVESGLPHLSHALVNLCMIIDLQENLSECDDRGGYSKP
jgi:hypothetical protein